MPASDICDLSLDETHRLYRSRSLSPVEVVDACLARIERLNPVLNAFVTLDADGARKAARAAEAMILAQPDELPFLFGIPFSVKDTLPTAGVRTTFGATLFNNFTPTEDAAIVAALKRDGCIFLGKTNSPAFGWTGVTENRVFGPTRNPWNPTHTSGGSSGGAAVAAAAGLCPINIGTDGGGSLRIPASFTQTVGFKATSGRVPNYPMGLGGGIQHIGAIARTVDDSTRIFANISKPCHKDIYSLPALEADFIARVAEPPPRLRILYAEALGYHEAIDAELAMICRRAAGTFQALGCEVVEKKLSWPSPEPIWKAIFTGNLANRLKSFAHRFDELEPELRRLVEEELREPHDYLQTSIDRNEWSTHPLAIHETFDLLITPVTACPPFPTGRFSPREDRSSTIYGWMPFAYPFNLTGQPAISMPAGLTDAGLPVGIQIIGARFSDALVMSAARAYEQANGNIVAWNETNLICASNARVLTSQAARSSHDNSTPGARLQ